MTDWVVSERLSIVNLDEAEAPQLAEVDYR
jgi:hypothetical protein